MCPPKPPVKNVSSSSAVLLTGRRCAASASCAAGAAYGLTAASDTDGDGFTNEDEVTIHGTLPGYSCANYTLASETPANFQSLITPGVPTCLEPRDIAVAPDVAAFRTEVGKTETVDVIVSNNGADLPLTVTGFAVLPGSDPAYTVTGPGVPVAIPLGQSITLTVQFAPTVPGLPNGTLRIQSDDPDEPCDGR